MDSETLPTSGIVVHIWPSQWDLPTFDPLCLATVLYLQLTIPGKFKLLECSNPDSSPAGQLPFLVHDQYTVASFGGIVKYLSGLRNADYKTYPDANLDAHLTASERAQKTAWLAHAESHLGDLVYHILYANSDNWVNMTNPALASMFPVPQKYYVPRRMRNSYYPRLASAGLWKQVVEEEKPQKEKFPRDVKPAEKERLSANTTLSQAFDKEKVVAKARYELDIYSDLLDSKTFVFQNKLSTVDVVVAAHILLLLYPPVSDPLLKDLVTESYPTLLAHARKVHALALGANTPTLSYEAPSSSLWAIIPAFPRSSSSSSSTSKKSAEQTPEDLQFKKMRWGFFGAALGSLVVYVALLAPRVQITWRPAEEHNQGFDDPEDDEFSVTVPPEVEGQEELDEGARSSS